MKRRKPLVAADDPCELCALRREHAAHVKHGRRRDAAYAAVAYLLWQTIYWFSPDAEVAESAGGVPLALVRRVRTDSGLPLPTVARNRGN